MYFFHAKMAETFNGLFLNCNDLQLFLLSNYSKLTILRFRMFEGVTLSSGQL